MKRVISLLVFSGLAGLVAADTLQLNIDPTKTLSYGVLAVGFRDTVYGRWPTYEDVELIPLVDGGNNPLVFNANQAVSMSVNVPNALGLTLDYYTFVGSYQDNLAQWHATIGFSSSVASGLLGQPWPFPNVSEPEFVNPFLFSSVPNYYGNADRIQIQLMPTMIDSAEHSSNPSWIQPFWSLYGSGYPVSGLDAPTVGQDGSLVNFSNGTPGGTVRLNAVPEPAPVLGLAGALVVLGLRRRMR